MSRPVRLRGRIPSPPEKKKVSVSMSVELGLKERFDEFVKRNKLRSRAAALQHLLDSFDAQRKPPTSLLVAEASRKGKKNVKLTPASATTKTSCRRTRASLNGWTNDDIARLKETVEVVKPRNDDDWQHVAKVLGNGHGIEDCRMCAQVQMQYFDDAKSLSTKTPRKPTLRSRQARDYVMKKAIVDESDSANDFFGSKPVLQPTLIPVVELEDMSCLNTPASVASCRSRFAMDKFSPLGTPSLLLGSATKNVVGSSTRKRANQCINQMGPILTKIRTVRPHVGTPKLSRAHSRRGRSSQQMNWEEAAPQANSCDSELEESADSYLSDNSLRE